MANGATKVTAKAVSSEIVRKAEKAFLERCTANGKDAAVSYFSVQYGILKNTLGDDNFVIASNRDNPNDYAFSYMIFPTADSRIRWYTAVTKCTEKIKGWIRIAAKNKVKEVNKEIPIYEDGSVKKVYAYVNGITRGRNAAELAQKVVREPVTLSALQPTTQLVRFIGDIKAIDDKFQRFQVAIMMPCGDAFGGAIFYEYGTAEEIDNKIVEFLTFVNPESFEKMRKTQSKKEDLFR